MITSQQMRAARALLSIDQRQLAALAGVSLPTIQRMEASDGQVIGSRSPVGKLGRTLLIAYLTGPGDASVNIARCSANSRSCSASAVALSPAALAA